MSMNCMYCNIGIRSYLALKAVFFTAFFLCVTGVYSIDTIRVNKFDVDLHPLFEYYVDSTGNESFQEIKDKANKGEFVRGIPTQLYNQFEDYAYWVHFVVKKHDDDWLFVLSDPYAGKVDFYNVTSDSLYHFKSGVERPFSVRQFSHTDHLFKLHFDGDEHVECFLKLKSIYRFSPNFVVTRENDIFQGSVNSYYIRGVLYGVLILLVFYNAIVYVLLKESVYLYYALYLITAMLYVARDHFIGYQYLWPEYPAINFYVINFDKAFLMLGFSLFSVVFLHLYKELRKLKIVVLLNVLFLVLLLVEVFMSTHLMLSNYLEPIVYSVIFYYAIQEYKSGKRYIRLYLIAFTVWFIGFLIFTSMGKGWLPSLSNTSWAPFSFNIALLLETLIMTIALMDRFRVLKENTIHLKNENISMLKEKEQLVEKVNKELEQKVLERTEALNSANQELQQKNKLLKEQADEITKMNLSLDKDNYRLKKEMRKVIESRFFSKDFTYEEFLQIFADDLSCFKHLAELKWVQHFECKKCRHSKSTEGYRKFSRKCLKCGYDETVTAGTLFHQLRFPLRKAFFILIKTLRYGDDFSISELSEELDLRKATCSSFRKKIMLYKQVMPENLSGEMLWKAMIFPQEN